MISRQTIADLCQEKLYAYYLKKPSGCMLTEKRPYNLARKVSDVGGSSRAT
ncbi:hypothetical protein [Streptococcus canis]|uniref:hypothetical protein n=1 Tax=Streptococcus canis TaxID=1329 RepID=UPI0013D8E585|nr:hypothetical protein [Streptococcus canis]QKG76924.1 hypothetical protein GE021_001545 [Streptococcus canis]